MKLRVKHNSVRLRLNRSEVQRLLSERSLEERIEFNGDGSNALVYFLRLESSAQAVMVEFEGGTIVITLPERQADLWARSREEVGIYFEKPIGNGKTLSVIVEKDFQCSEAMAGAIDPDAYPNPSPHATSGQGG